MALSDSSAVCTLGSGNRDVGRLYREFSAQLERTVRGAVRAPQPVVEDACQFAWSRLIHHRSRLREETAIGWLVATAIHEAFKLSGRAARELSLDQALEDGLEPAATAPQPWEVLLQRERMATVRALAPRPQRIVWLQALGFSYREMAHHEHCTRRTVERQLISARNALKVADEVGR